MWCCMKQLISDCLYNICILFKDRTIYCQSTGKEYYLTNAFKISIGNNNLLAIAPHKILYVMFDSEIQFYRRYWGLITDGEAGNDNDEYYRLIINGCVHYAGIGRMRIKHPYELLQMDYNTKIYKNGFSNYKVFYKTGVPPCKVFCITRECCMAFINDALYYFKTIDGKESISMFLFDDIDDIFYSYSNNELFYFDKHGQFHVWQFEDFNEE